MESLLSLAFDNISSVDATKIRKGLRQIEGLLAQICLSSAPARSPRKGGDGMAEAKGLGVLREDAAFREFFRLQEGFRCNGKQMRQNASVPLETNMRHLQWPHDSLRLSSVYLECPAPQTTTSSSYLLWNYCKECYSSTRLHDHYSAAKSTSTSYSTSSIPPTRQHYNHKRYWF
jgi:hypothetical protein